MAVKAKKTDILKTKTVSVQLETHQIQGREPVLLFTASQIDEVLAEAEIQAVPFASDYFVGLCAWREQVLPVIDLVRFFELSALEKENKERYLVVRFVDNVVPEQDEKLHSAKRLQRCILKVSDQIVRGDIPMQCEVVAPKQAGLPPTFVRGIFQGDKDVFILPDLAAILQANAAVSGE
ncbi:MAG: hypothetical protein D3910_06240 [Candidatus Electrothrix sp. ATG2]|nr:hypothetical protein [Candidatus Electrothrix sp. ATG2]